MTLLLTLNPESTTEAERMIYRTREAARAVVTDEHQNIALLYVAKDNYYKLPGGGIEQGEDPRIALDRECQEEIGCEITVTEEIGTIIEYRKFCDLIQTSYCYFAQLKGEKGRPTFTDDEIAEGFQQLWVPYSEALSLLEKNQAYNLEGREYIVPRDLCFLKAAPIHLP